MKRKFLIFLSFCLIFSNLFINNVEAEENNYNIVNVDTNDILGTYSTYTSAYSNMNNMKNKNNSISYGIKLNDKLIQCDYAVARITEYFNFIESDSNRQGYASGGSATDAAYISTAADGSTIRIKLAGQMMDVPIESIYQLVLPSKTDVISYYTNTNSGMVHYYYTYSSTNGATLQSICVGPTYFYFSSGVKYYSYDGHYFYKDYKTMINDYRNGNYNHAINAGNPYYNYFQYLPHRASSNITSSEINQYIVSKIGSSSNSVMYDSGSNFVYEGAKYGVNPLLMFGLALYESGYGRSNYALTHNNLFGHGANDLSPATTVYETVDECIAYHAFNFISSGYSNPADSRYRGSHYGDKQSGMNVKYASTPYWGEVAASVGYYLGNDYGKYTLGMVDGDIKIYNEPSISSTTLYSTGATGSSNDVKNVPVIVLEKVSGYDGKDYYKIMSDAPLNSSRTKIDPTGIYDYSRDYAYILASNVTIVNSSNNIVTTPGTPVTPTNYKPTGVVDSISSSEAGSINVSGWCYDKDDVSQNIDIKVYIGNTCLGVLSANRTRNDVNTAYGITGAHGFSGKFNTNLYGDQIVTIKAVDLYTNNEYVIGYDTIYIEKGYTNKYNPQGVLDYSGVTNNQIKLSGWAFDKDDTAESIQIRIKVDETLVATWNADQERDDVNKVYNITGKHGFSGKITASMGNHKIDIYMVDLGTSKEYLLVSQVLTIDVVASEMFNDVEDNQWYSEYVNYAFNRGLMSGYDSSRFGTYDTVTREQMVQVLYNLAGKPKVTNYSATSKFSDVYSGAWYEDAVNWAYNNQITVGMNDIFGTGIAMNREQMVTFLMNYTKLIGKDTSTSKTISSYPDYQKVDEWARNNMAWSVGIGLISGVEKNQIKYLDPLGNATRAQLATVLTKYCTYYNI